MRTEHDTEELGLLANAISAECAAMRSGNAELTKLASRVREILQRANRLSDNEAEGIGAVDHSDRDEVPA